MCGNSLTPLGSSSTREVRTMRSGAWGSGFQKAVSTIRQPSATMRSAKPKAWKVSTLRG
jgi:hypothetical protein